MTAGFAPMPADSAPDGADNPDDAEAAELHPPTEDAAQVLLDLKKAKGTLRVAYECITVENRWAMHLLLVLVRPLWSRYAKNIKENRTSADILLHHVSMARGMWEGVGANRAVGACCRSTGPAGAALARRRCTRIAGATGCS